jgi:cysteine synthase B
MANYSLLDTIGNTPMVELKNMSPKKRVRIFAKLEGQNPTGSVKDRIAKSMIEKAEEEGRLGPGITILEPTSGNTGISLAFVARLKGYEVTAVMPDNVSTERSQLLKAHGAQIIYSDGKYGSNGAIALAEEIAKEDQGNRYYMPFQYGNSANPDAHYQSTGMEIVRDLPEVDFFVAGLGTGGTLMGVGRRLKEHRKDVQIIAVAPEPDETIQGLRDLDEGFIPPILDISLLDARIMAKTMDAFAGTRELLKQEGIFAGISAGSVVWAAMKIASKIESGNIVCLFADGGWKYLSSGIWTKDSEQMEEEARGKIWW